MAARAVWQRTANRYFVQQDAKRPPKLASSSFLSNSKQIDTTRPAAATDVDDTNFLILDDKSLYPESKWWLQLQPDGLYQRGFIKEQVNALEAQNPSHHQFVENTDSTSSLVSNMLKDSYEFVEMDSVDFCKGFKEVNYEYNMESKVKHWMGMEQTCELSIPWWQMTQKDDHLVSFVSSKGSHDFSCDLLDSKPQKIITENDISRIEVQPVTSNPISDLSIGSSDNTSNEEKESGHEIDSSKRKILEALRHSQTRARKAENAAKEAYAEKEHVIKLLLRQASQLFAYRQWIYLLQLENLYYQINNNPVSPLKTTKQHKKAGKTRSRRPGSGRYHDHKYKIGKSAVVFVVGLGIVGAGLLLGWTLGWMLL